MYKIDAITNDATIIGSTSTGTTFVAWLPLFIIKQAWLVGADYEDLADDFGLGAGTGGDWSAIRDSSPSAIRAMLERALNHLFSGD